MAAGNWVNWSTGDLVTASAFQDIQDSIVFIYSSESAANAALTNKVVGTLFYDSTALVLKAWNGSAWITAESGDITGVTAGNGLSGGGTSGDVQLDLDASELSTTTVATNDYVVIEDVTDNSTKKVTVQSILDQGGFADIGLIIALG